MQLIDLIRSIIEIINNALGGVLLFILAAGIIIGNIRVAIAMAMKEFKKTRKKGDTKTGGGDEQISWFALISRTIYLLATLVIPQIIAIGFIWLFPLLFVNLLKPETTRWIIIIVVAILAIYLSTKRYGGFRGLASVTGHLIILLLGWSLGKWLGMIMISLPFIALYYYLLYRLAEVVIPASDPDNPMEKRERFKIFIGYMWGIQYPVIIVPNRANAKAETRINGSVFNRNPVGAPGYIWTNAYQVVGLTAGTNFSRVEGPGAIYTRRFERVKEVMDLRAHLRTIDISAITQNGIKIQATVFASFRIDRLPFDNTIRSRLRHAGSYPYSRPRVQAALRLEGVSATPSDPGNPPRRWDDEVMSQIEEATRRVIAETSLEELWHPGRQDGKEISSLDLIDAKIRDRLAGFSQNNGIHIFSARIVNYALPGKDEPGKMDSISAARLPLWKSRLERTSNKKLAEATAEAEQKQLNAAVVASTKILKSIAESLKSTETMKGSFSRNLIAMRYLNIIYDTIKEQPNLKGEKEEKLMQKISIFRGY